MNPVGKLKYDTAVRLKFCQKAIDVLIRMVSSYEYS